MILRGKEGEEAIHSVDDWKRLAPPKAGYQWKEGRSAFELARAWCETGKSVLPADLRALFDSCEHTRGFVPEFGWPEHLISFDSHSGPSNADLALIGTAPTGKLAVVIEAKADEPFGDLVGETLSAALERGIANNRSNGVRRVDDLARALFRPREGGQPVVVDLRYQLMTAVAATLAFADKHDAKYAVLIVHEFATDQTSDIAHRRNADDYERFIERLSGEPIDAGDEPNLRSPLSVPGSALFPGGRSLLIGKLTTNRRQRELRRTERTDAGAQFKRYIGIDYSGAEVATASLKGLRIYSATHDSSPAEVEPPAGLKKYWTRKAVAHWLVEQLSKGPPALVGIDHGFSFPRAYFRAFGVPPGWDLFLDDFCAHWPTGEDHVYVDFVRDGASGNGAVRMGSTKWRRVTEVRSKAAKSLFHFDVQGSVAKSTHSGLPWLRFIRHNVTRPVHFWPFDGWEVPDGTSAIVEVYPRLWNRAYPKVELTDDQHDAWVIAEWMRTADADGRLRDALMGPVEPADREAGVIEGWILGV